MICYGYGTNNQSNWWRWVLRTRQTIRNFKQFASNIRSVCLVEASPALRETQRTLLCGDNPFESIDGGVQSTSKHLGIPIKWFEDIRFVPQGIYRRYRYLLEALLTTQEAHLRPLSSLLMSFSMPCRFMLFNQSRQTQKTHHQAS